jgi:hypothetical protein
VPGAGTAVLVMPSWVGQGAVELGTPEWVGVGIPASWGWLNWGGRGGLGIPVFRGADGYWPGTGRAGGCRCGWGAGGTGESGSMGVVESGTPMWVGGCGFRHRQSICWFAPAMGGRFWHAGVAEAGRFRDSGVIGASELVYRQGSINQTLTAKDHAAKLSVNDFIVKDCRRRRGQTIGIRPQRRLGK